MPQTLEEVRKAAVGQELDEELAAQFPVREQRDLYIPRNEGKIHVYLYFPLQQIPGAPAIINMHGGGFVKGYRGRDIVFSRSLAYHTGHMVVDVDYATAPEKKYPYALEEGYFTARYFAEHAAEYGITPGKVLLSGASAGANMVTGINFLAKERQEFEIVQTILAYPPMDLWSDPVSKATTEAERERGEIGRLYNDWYVDEKYRRDICVSPIFAAEEQLHGLAPFLILTGGNDSLSPEAEKFAWNLMQAGVTVTVRHTPGAGHGFLVRRQPGFQQAEQLIFRTIGATDLNLPLGRDVK